MSALNGYWLPALDPVTGMLALPLWIAGALAALFVVVCVLAFNRTVAASPVLMVVRYAVILVAALLAWAVIDRSAIRERAAERRALEARATELTARAIAPGSALACLDASAGEAVETACEKALFASPASVAAAVSYVGARLSLLADSLDYTKRIDPSYAGQLAVLRRAAENDRFGLVAHVLATRDGCTAETCPTFKLLEDTSRVSANLKENLLEAYVARHAASWPKGESFSTASTPPAPGGPPVPSTYNFPSAVSIPPVSIMTAEPPTAAPPLASQPPLVTPAASAAAPPATGEAIVNPPSPPRKPPQAAAPPKKQAPTPPRIPQPGQGATPATPPATAGNAPPPAAVGQPRAQ